jgi:hypothetical protein
MREKRTETMGFEMRTREAPGEEPIYYSMTRGAMAILRSVMRPILSDEDIPSLADALCNEEPWPNQAPADPHRVPRCKLFYNDGYWLTPGECRVLAAHLEAVVSGAAPIPDGVDEQGFDWRPIARRFATFCRWAAERDGFGVT